MKNNLKSLRWGKEWSLGKLARKSGVSKSTICEIENGKNEHPSIDVAYKLHKALNVDVWEIFYEE